MSETISAMIALVSYPSYWRILDTNEPNHDELNHLHLLAFRLVEI